MAARFTRSPGAPLWSVEPAPPACVVAYAPLAGSGSPPDSLSVAESWEAFPGTYLVLPAGTSLSQGLADSLAAFRAGRPLRFVWVADPADYGPEWDACWIAAAPGSGATEGLGSVRLRNYALWLGGGCGIGLAAGGEGIAITPRPGDPDSVTFSAGFGAATLAGGAAVTLPLGTELAGSALTGLTLENGAAAGIGDFERLDVGLRIFASDPAQPWLPDRLASWRYPVFASPQPASGASLPVALSLHPLLPEAPYTSLDLLETSTGPAELASCYVTSNGKAVHLVPLAPSGEPELAARLVPALRPLSDGPSPADPFYLVPSGCFRVKVLDDEGHELTEAQRLMCGKSGIEYIEIEQPGSEIWFAPGGAALAVGKGLEAMAKTAYAAVFGSGGAAGGSYWAQAEGAALFAPSKTAFMPFRTLSGKSLAAAPGGGKLPGGYPMLPFTGIRDGKLGPYEQLEYQAVASTRKALIEALPSPRGEEAAVGPGAEPTTQALTPQGLLADVGASGRIANLTLALSPAGAVEMTGVSDALVAALQASQLFLVATDPESLAATLPVTGEVEIPSSPDGTQLWGIEVWPQEWSASKTMLVLKFAGKSLVELMADTTTWAGHEGADFNKKEGVAKAQQTLQAAVEQALSSKAPEFQSFAELAKDPSWEGVLFLNAPVPPAELPPEIAGLAAGLDASAFKAHHIGLTVTPATNEGGTVTPKPSSLFGLIFYESPNSAAGGAPPYSFAVRSLKVRFENSLVKTFASTIELLVDQLFGEPASLVERHEGELRPQSPNLLLLEGVYQQQGSHGGYTFTTGNADLFSVASPVLDLVEVSLAQFVTVVPPQPREPTKPAQSRFVLSGSIRFQAPPAGVADVFSFGPEADAKEPLSAAQLFYSNLWITLDYVPAERSKDRYTFDASKAIPDPTRSVPREGSLAAGFPLTPTSFVQVGPPESPPPPPAKPPTPATPASLGFLGIGTEPALGSTIKAPWFGLVADLGFGTAGALAAEAGFKASMLFAWAPGDPKVANAGIGLKLPGTGSGAKLLSLQGVLKLKIGELTLADTKDTGGIYVLELDRIALGVLMLSLPSSGQIRALLFADPTGKDHTTLGWYAGYAKTGGS